MHGLVLLWLKQTIPNSWTESNKSWGRVVRSLIFPLLLSSCVSKIDSYSWYNSWLNKNYWLLLLFNSCVTIYVDCEYLFKSLKHSAKNYSYSGSCSNQKLIYYNMFYSIIQYSLIYWGRASKYHLHKVKIMQNRFLRVSLLRKRNCPLDSLYFTFGILKLDAMIEMEYAKFMYRLINNMLPEYFNN